MSADLWFTPGLAPDVAIRDGRVHLVFGHQPLQWLELGFDGALLDKRTLPIGYYPKTNGQHTLTHDGDRFVAWARGGSVAHPPGLPVGVHATGLSDNGLQFFYRRGDDIFTQTGAYCGGMALPNAYSSYGIWTCADDGTCKTWDEWYYAPKVPGVTGQQQTSVDGRVTVGEASNGGIAGKAQGTPFLLWPSENTRWPRVACDGAHVAICCWGEPGPRVRVWIGTLDELAAVRPMEPRPMRHLDTVIAERAKYGTPLGNANAWAIVNAVAWAHRHEGWGILAKPSGNNHVVNGTGYSVDVIVNVGERVLVDCLQDSEGEGRPTWNELGWDDSFAERWRAAIWPGGTVPQPPPTPPPVPPPTPPVDTLEQRVAALETTTRHILEHLRAV